MFGCCAAAPPPDPERQPLLGAAASDALPARPARRVSLDLLKAAAIVCVVLEHSSRPALFVADLSWAEQFTGVASAAATPLFLFVSGFLGAAVFHPLPPLPRARRVIVRMLARLLPPYLVASIVAAFVRDPGGGPAIGSADWWAALFLNVLKFNSRGIYYYVALALACIGILPLVAFASQRRWSTAAFLVLSCTLRVLLVGTDLIPLDLTVKMRLPFFGLWAFAAGFAVRVHVDPPLSRLVAESPRRALLAALPLLVGSALWLADVPWFFDRRRFLPSDDARLANWSRAAHDVAFVVGVSCFAVLVSAYAPRRLCANPLVLYLSECTYTIYLYHVFFIDAQYFDVILARHETAESPSAARWTLQRFVLGLGGSMIVALLGTALLGPWAVNVLGARLPFDPCGRNAPAAAAAIIKGGKGANPSSHRNATV